MPRQYPPEFKERAVRMVEEASPDHAVRSNCGKETLPPFRTPCM